MEQLEFVRAVRVLYLFIFFASCVGMVSGISNLLECFFSRGHGPFVGKLSTSILVTVLSGFFIAKIWPLYSNIEAYMQILAK